MVKQGGYKQIQADLEVVYNAIEDYLFENHKFCSSDEVKKNVPISDFRVRKALKELVRRNKVSIVFEGRGKPTVYVPMYMLQEILRTQRKPRWVEKHAFGAKRERLKQITKAQEDIRHYEMLERLLYGTGTPLEEAVTYALQRLDFENVKHHEEEGYQDVSFLSLIITESSTPVKEGSL